jgi:eukaryotic-like serine/threonine-protein kinase
MADVYRADDLVAGRPVAVKVLRALQATDLRRFASEADALARLDHPSIVRLLDRGEQDGVPYLVLDLVDGEALSSALSRGPLPEPAVVAVGAEVAAGLAHAHEAGIVHRDVKPSNVLVDRDGHAHLADFGIARLHEASTLTAAGTVVGTACYLAPEQVSGGPTRPPADVYALGLVLLEALTGSRAFPGGPAESSIARLQRDPVMPEGIAPWLAETLTSMTNRDPDRRPDATQVAVALTEGTAAPLAGRPAAAVAAARAAEEPETTAMVANPQTEVLPVPLLPAPAPSGAAGAADADRPARRRRLAWWSAAAAVLVGLAALIGVNADRGAKGIPATADTSTTVPTTVVTTTTTTPPTTATPSAPAAPKGKGHNKRND